MKTGRRPHWISSFLTAPWEINPRGELEFHDFERDEPGRPTPSARLFRESRRRRVELEERLNQLLETPLAKARDALLEPGQLEISDWSVFRALVLTIVLQAGRTSAMLKRRDDEFAAMLRFSDVETDQLVQLAMKGRQLVRVGSNAPAHALFYPSTGLFQMLTRDPGCITGWTLGIAIPLSPSIAFALISESADCAWLFEQCTTGHHLQALSLSGPRIARAVIPPVLLATSRDALHADVRRYRNEMVEYFSEIQRQRASAIQMHERECGPVRELDPLTQKFGHLES